MKRLLMISLVLALALSCMLLVACGPCALGHDWGEWETTAAPSCTAAGVQTRTCAKCGEEETQSFGKATGHTSVVAQRVEPTCTENGYTAGHRCSVCDAVLDGVETIPANGHRSIVKMAVAATCTKSGTTKGHVCMICNAVLDGVEEVPALGHSTVEIPAVGATCTEPAYSAGSKCERCNEVFVAPEISAPALGHSFDEASLNYVTYTACDRECGAYKILGSRNVYENDFVFDFDDTKISEIDGTYNDIMEVLAGTGEVLTGEEFDELFEIYDEQISYVQFQYQVARVFNDISYTLETREDFNKVSEYYNKAIENYYGLFKAIYESDQYSEYFFRDWTEDEIQEVLELADSYDADNRTAADDITEAYEDLMAEMGSLKDATQAQRLALFDLYSQLIVANNNIAQTAGYQNYMEYAYANIYERDYSPADVAAMRGFVRQYIGPIVEQVATEYTAWNNAYQANGGWKTDEGAWYYSQFKSDYIWRDMAEVPDDAKKPNRINAIVQSRQNLVDYYRFLSENTSDAHDSFYGSLCDLFENGNYFLGTNPNRTAYTWYIYQLELPIMLFTTEYKDSFTFVHEYGHYYQRVYNGGLSVPMDHDETQSQGNEMMYLAWLRAHMPAGVDEGFEILELEQLINMLGSIVLSTAVDEFEYLAYTGATEYNGLPIATVQLADGSSVVDYAKLYEDILCTYWEDIGSFFNTGYWSYVVFDQAAYYISYAMSALPCLEIYAKAGVDGLAAARDSYVKLFTFGDEEQFVQTDETVLEDGTILVDRYLKDGVTYQTILNWAGLNGPFQEELYQTIQAFFAAR